MTRIRHTPSMPVVTQSSINLEFSTDNVPVSLHCNVLEYSITDRRSPIGFDHPSPAFCRFFLFREGSAAVKAGGETKVLTGNVIHLLPVGQPFIIDYGIGILYYFHVSVRDHAGLPLFAEIRGIPELRDSQLFEQIISAMNNGNSAQLTVLLGQVVISFAEPLLSDLARRVQRSNRFEQVLNWVQAEPPASLTIKDLAMRMHLSRSALSKGFQRAMGVSLKQYINDTHVQKAKERLVYSDVTVKELAQELGHPDAHYFHRIFRKATGMTPLAYRRHHQKSTG